MPNACGSDDDDGGGNTVACKTTKINGEFYCMESPKDKVIEMLGSVDAYKAQCEKLDPNNKDDRDKLSKEFLNSCPGGYTYKCENTRAVRTTYMYAERYKGVSCDEIIEL